MSAAIKRTQGAVNTYTTVEIKGLSAVKGTRMTFLVNGVERKGVVQCRYPYSCVVLLDPLDVPAHARTGPCPCGGTWGVCTYHGGGVSL